MAEKRPWRVVLVGDDVLARGGLSALCARGGLVVLAETSTQEAARTAAREGPDALIWDVGNVARSVDRLRSLPSIPVVALISDPEEAIEILAAGARGLLFREADASQLESAVQAVCRRTIVLDEALSHLLRQPRAESPETETEALTARETEVLQILSLGLSNKEIAQRLGISEHTAKFHVNAILGKLGADSRTEAVVIAARLGLLIL